MSCNHVTFRVDCESCKSWGKQEAAALNAHDHYANCEGCEAIRARAHAEGKAEGRREMGAGAIQKIAYARAHYSEAVLSGFTDEEKKRGKWMRNLLAGIIDDINSMIAKEDT